MFEVGTGSLLSNESLKAGKIPRISAKSENNGILGYFSSENLANARYFENFITVNFFGADGGIFYHPYKASVEMKVHTLKMPNKEFNTKTGNFIASALKLSLRGFGYGNQLSSSKLKDSNFRIQLPIKNGEIDLEFMESFFEEFEADRMLMLNEYLVSTGLNNYALTTDEQQLLASFENGKVEWGEFNYNSIFNKIVQGRRLKKVDQTAGDIPFIMAGTTNMGVVNYISNPVASFPKNSITVDIFGNTFYRNYDYGAGDDTGVYWHSEKTYAKTSMLFLATAISKSISGKFDYGTKLRSSQSLDFKMSLPMRNNQPDYEFMEMLISAVQKTVIKGVVEYVTGKHKIYKK